MPAVTVPFFRGDQEFELEVSFSFINPDKLSSIQSWYPEITKVEVYNPSERAWVSFELTEKEEAKIEDFIIDYYDPEEEE